MFSCEEAAGPLNWTDKASQLQWSYTGLTINFVLSQVDMYSGALFIKQAIGWNLYLSIAILLAMTIVSTLAG